MLEKLIGYILLAFMLLGCVQIFRYFYLVWFRSDEYLRQAKNNMIQARKKLPKFIGNLEKPPISPSLAIVRLVISFVFLIALIIFVAIIWALFMTWFNK
jgi:hypothetical protein